jgi:DNA mismatch endonuclease (patch repair protein)
MATVPATRTSFWGAKFRANRERDERARRELRAMGWRSLIVWECEISRVDRLERRLRRFLEQ